MFVILQNKMFLANLKIGKYRLTVQIRSENSMVHRDIINHLMIVKLHVFLSPVCLIMFMY